MPTREHDRLLEVGIQVSPLETLGALYQRLQGGITWPTYQMNRVILRFT
jgi:hypothetical protein